MLMRTPKSLRRRIAFTVVLLTSLGGALADDWPQWRGPERNGVSRETGLLAEWPAAGPKLRWKVSDLGSGYATPSVVGDRVYLLGNDGLQNEFVEARSVADGKQVWTARLGKVGNPDQMPNFPAARSTPTVDGETLFALGSDGDLACLERSTGKVLWKKNLRVDFKGKPGGWAYTESPLVDGDTLVSTPGGGEATIVALNKRTGDTIWRCSIPEGGDAAYASAVVLEADGLRQYVQMLNKGIVGVEAKTGKLLWHDPRPVSRFNANIPTPTVSAGYVYFASAGTGAGAVKVAVESGGVKASPLYFEPDLPTSIGGTVKVGDYLYGTTSQALVCLEMATGKVRWKERALGAASLLYADGRLYLHGENGEVALVEPSTEGYREKGRFAPPDQPKRRNQMEKAWAYPVVANGYLYLRDHGMLWCYDLRSGE